VAWRRPIGVGYDGRVEPRVEEPRLIDDGPWGGVPLGGMGSGSIGRTSRGDFARWHLDPGTHRFESVAACQFSVYTERDGERQAHVLSTIRPDTLPSWGWDLPEGAGTYHALYPSAWYEYDWDALPVSLLQHQASPVIAGDYDVSSHPVGTFSWQVTNPGLEPVTVGLMFTFQDVLGRAQAQDRRGDHRHEVVRHDDIKGVAMHGPADAAGAAWHGSLAIAAVEAPGVTVTVRDVFDIDDGADVWADFAADGRLDDIDDSPPSEPGQAIGAAVAATVELAPGASVALQFALAWDLPLVEFGGGTCWYRRHTRWFGRDGRNAFSIAIDGLTERDARLARIEAWQAPVLDDPSRPDWYKAALFNELYFLVDGGTAWVDGRADGGPVPDDADRDDRPDLGRFAILECFDYAFYNTVDVNFYASWALLLLWPRLERSVIRDVVPTIALDDPEVVTLAWHGGRARRKAAGAAPHDIGGPAGDPFLRPNQYAFQDINIWKDLNSKFVLQLWRDAVLLDEPELATGSWRAITEAIDYLARFDRDGDGLPEHDGVPDQTFDTWSMHGPSAYSGALWLAALRAAIEIGRRVGDDVRVAAYRERVTRASEAFETKLWNGRHYRFDTGDGPSADAIMAGQLAGQWYADATGLGDLVPPDRILTTLRTIFAANVQGFGDGEMGAVNGTLPDGSIDESSLQSAEVWIGVTYALAALMLGRGMTDEGWQTARGAAAVTYERGLWFRTPEAYDAHGGYRASLYLRPLAIWAIEHALAGIAREPGSMSSTRKTNPPIP
jgi:non-lysosomal glucosylceramidase